MTEGELLQRRKYFREALEACRKETVLRLKSRNLPLSMTTRAVRAVDHSETGGWRIESVELDVSPLRFTQVLIEIQDSKPSLHIVGLTDQLLPLAEYLDRTTDLGSRPGSLYPDATGTEAILARYLAPVALTYLRSLRSVARPRPALVEALADDLDLLCDPSRVAHLIQVPFEGLRVRRRMVHRNVVLRPLSAMERGAFLQGWEESLVDAPLDPGAIAMPSQFSFFAPRVVLEIHAVGRRDTASEGPRLAHRVALAFFLSGFELGGSGTLASFDLPRWASFGVTQGPFPVAEKVVQDHWLTLIEFRRVVDLAHQIPNFGGAEGRPQEVALFRILRASGMDWRESPFLDFAIGLEAALLGGTSDELSYRFSLYGALYLRAQRDPEDVFMRLKNIYRVRSKLVHGGHVSPESRAAAEGDASDLAKAVIKKAVVEGWPESEALDAAALRHAALGQSR